MGETFSSSSSGFGPIWATGSIDGGGYNWVPYETHAILASHQPQRAHAGQGRRPPLLDCATWIPSSQGLSHDAELERRLNRAQTFGSFTYRKLKAFLAKFATWVLRLFHRPESQQEPIALQSLAPHCSHEPLPPILESATWIPPPPDFSRWDYHQPAPRPRVEILSPIPIPPRSHLMSLLLGQRFELDTTEQPLRINDDRSSERGNVPVVELE